VRGAAAARAERLLEYVRILAPLVEAERQALDTKRELSPALHGALVTAGLFRLWLPRQLGGAALDPVAGLRVIAAVAALDGSVGWSVMVPAAYGLLAGRLPARAAARIFGDRRAAVAGNLAPFGKAEAIEGGYRASGRWPFGSGGRHATWFLARCAVRGRGRARPGPTGRPATRLLFVPADRCRIHDTWHVSGLRGTGSHDYSMKDVRVPAAYSIDLLAGRPTRPEPLYAFPLIPFVEAAVAAVPIGIARAALDAFTELAKTRRAGRSQRPLRADPTAQRELGRAELHARSAEALLFSAVDDVWRTVKAGRRPTLAQRAQLRVGCVNAGTSAAAAVDVVYRLGGGASIFEGNRIERCFRDVHTAAQHGALAPKTLEAVGRVLLGLDPQGLL
jgi:alkylation response protein AidB-like acyl-CoA dehydrogenase